MSKPKISVEVTQEQYDVLNGEAEGVGKTLSALVRDRLFPEAILPPPLPELVAVAVPTAPAVAPRHPCRFLLKTYVPNYGPGHCQGTCGHPDQRQRPCFWMSNVAANCDKFTPFNARQR